MSREEKIKEIEEFPRRIRIFIAVILVLMGIGVSGFMLMEKLTPSQAFLRTLESLAFIFKDNSNIPERLLEIFLAIVGVMIIWWVLWSLADMILDGNLKKYIKRQFYIVKMKAVKKHVIIAGGGRVGEEIAKAISAKSRNFVIIENDESTVKALRKKGYNVIEGDAQDEKTLKEARIDTANKIILTLPKTETNILISLTAKELNPKIEIFARAENPSLVSKLKKVGAKIVIVPEVIAGDQIAKKLKL